LLRGFCVVGCFFVFVVLRTVTAVYG
jgi:hypothetical protein